MAFPWRRNLVRRKVIVNLKSGRSFRGILYKQAGPLLILRHVEMMESGQAIRVDGEVVVERHEVEFIQALYGERG